MIFVILGIVILLISFTAALISLIREQRRQEIGMVDEQPLGRTEENRPAARLESAKSLDATPAPPHLQQQESTADKFPWEEKPQNPEDQGQANELIPEGEVKLGGGFSIRELAGKKKEDF